jgi:hypothetical protein
LQSTKYSAEDETTLMATLWSAKIKNDPLAFVMFTFPWGQQGTPLAKFTGPRKWQRDLLQQLADHIKANGNKLDYDMFRKVVSSGRGIGKSALVSWLVLWMLTTRIGSTTIVSANTEAQLTTKTWPEVTKWASMAINRHWFEPIATRITMAKWLTTLVEQDLNRDTRLWAAHAQLWSAENPDAYAGTHNYDGVMVIFDEASGIPDAIWSVTDGFFTENTPDRFWFAFSNPRRNTGYFYEAFHARRAFWSTTIVDARTVEGTDQKVYERIIDEYGADSPQAHVEVYGVFPNESDDQFISSSLVDDAMERTPQKDPTAPIIIGVDPARFGSDATVIAVRKGRDILSIKRHRGADTMEVVGRVIEAIEEHNPALVVVDEGGVGGGVVDRLKEQRYKQVRGVNFGMRSRQPLMWGNKRAEMWGAMRDWLKTASIPADRLLKSDLISPLVKPDSRGTMFLESKKDMRARGLASPDCFIAGTLIKTPTGDRPIEQLRAGDVVCTPFGPTKVFRAWATETESLTIASFSNGAYLAGTGKHKVFVWGQGEKRLDTLAATDRLEPYGSGRFWLCRLLSAFGTSTPGIEFRQVVATTNQTGKLTPSGCFTAVSGAMLTALYRRACTSITAMATGATTRFPIWRPLMGPSIAENMPLSATQRAASEHQPPRRLPEPLSGMGLPRGPSGTSETASRHGPFGSQSAQPALPAASTTRRTSNLGPTTVLCPAQTRSATSAILRMFDSARGAARTLQQIAIARRPVAPVFVQTESVPPTPVFNLTLEEHNAYYANGTLVFNCADAICVTFAFPVASTARVDKTPQRHYAPTQSSWMGS